MDVMSDGRSPHSIAELVASESSLEVIRRPALPQTRRASQTSQHRGSYTRLVLDNPWCASDGSSELVRGFSERSAAGPAERTGAGKASASLGQSSHGGLPDLILIIGVFIVIVIGVLIVRVLNKYDVDDGCVRRLLAERELVAVENVLLVLRVHQVEAGHEVGEIVSLAVDGILPVILRVGVGIRVGDGKRDN